MSCRCGDNRCPDPYPDEPRRRRVGEVVALVVGVGVSTFLVVSALLEVRSW